MIKKAQIQFICITMSILLCVFAVIYVATCYIMHSVTNNNITDRLNDASQRYLTVKDDLIQPDCFTAVINVDENGKIESYNFWFDQNTFNEEEVKDIVNTSISRPYYSGHISAVYYKILPIDDDYSSLLLVAIDASTFLAFYRKSITNALIVLTVIYLVLLYVVYRLSFIVFKPIKDSLDKQKQFISNASHELKTPLTVISANADVLLQSEKNIWLNNITSQTERMNLIISDMLALAKMDEGKTKLISEEFNLSEVIVENVLPFDAVAFENGKNIELDVSPDLRYTGDSASVKKVVNILLDNAVKHAEHGGIIKVSLKKEGKNAVLTVFNTGSDVPTENSNRIFERFYRGENTRASEAKGSGLGLSIAKSIADVNKWKIFAQSIPNESMTITIVF